MDLFEIPDDYKPDHPLSDGEMDDITTYLKNHPLFMKEIPNNIDDNQHLVALQYLKQDQDPILIAENYNKQANKMLQETNNKIYHMKNAYAKYTEAIQLNCSSKAINAKLHCNRASINLKLKNYGKVIEDCSKCLKLDENYIKAYYREGKALIELGRLQECLILLKDRKQPQIIQLQKQIKKKINKIKQQKQSKYTMKKEQQKLIQQYCDQRGWKRIKRTQKLPENVGLKLIQHKLVIPLIIMYPQFSNFDLIASTNEQDTLESHIQQLLMTNLPWDTNKQYKIDEIQCYIELKDNKLKFIPLNKTINYLAKNIAIKDGIEIQLIHKNNKFTKQYLKHYQIIE